MNPGTYACAGMNKTASCSGNMASSPGIPISMARVGDKGTVVSISGREETKRFLEASGNVILDVKGSKIAIDRKMASKILFCPES